MLNDLGHFDLGEVQAVVAHGVLEFDGAQTAVSVAVHGAEHASQATEAVGASLLAEIDDLLLDFLEVADLHVLFHVGVAHVEVAALRAGKVDSCSLLLEVHIALVADDGLSLVERLGHTAATGEGVGTRGRAHVCVLSLQSFGVNCNGPGLSVVTLRDSLHELGVSGLSCAPKHTRLDGELIITRVLLHELAILGLHDLTADRVGCQVLRHQVLPVRRIEVTLLILGVKRLLPFTHFLHDLSLDFALHHLSLAADTCDTVCLALSRAVLSVVRREELLVGLAVDPLVRVVEHFALDRVLEVVVLLRDVRLRHSSKS